MPGGLRKPEWRIKSLSPTTKGALERAQPYNHPHLELPPILDLLNTLNNENKHRTLNLVATSLQSLNVVPESASQPPSQTELIHPIIEGKTKILSFMMEPPQPNFEYRVEGNFPICILHDAGPSKSPMNDLVSVLHLMIEEVERITKTFTDLFEDMAALPQATNFRLENRTAIFHFPANLPDGE